MRNCRWGAIAGPRGVYLGTEKILEVGHKEHLLGQRQDLLLAYSQLPELQVDLRVHLEPTQSHPQEKRVCQVLEHLPERQTLWDTFEKLKPPALGASSWL